MGPVTLGARDQGPVAAVNVSPLEQALLDAVVRLARLTDAPDDARLLLEPINREIVYRLLQGEQGSRLRHVAILGGAGHRMTKAIERIRREFDRPLRVELLARESAMSVSSFYQHFKAVTTMSPL